MIVARLFPLLLCVACAASEMSDGVQGGGREPLAPAVRDSAGVTLYEHAADAMERAPRFVMSKKAVTELRGDDFEVELTRVDQPLLLADGRVVIFAEGSVLLVGTDGKVIERIGREGSGPGEFRDGTIRQGHGDTLLVQDNQNARVSFVVPGVGVVRSRPFRGSQAGGVFGVVGQFGDDGLLLGTDGFNYTPEFARHPVVWWRTARLQSGADSVTLLDSVPGPELRLVNGMPDIVLFTTIPVTTAWGEDFLVAKGGEWELVRMRADGAAAARVAIAMPRRAVDEAGVAADQTARFKKALQAMNSGVYEGRKPDTAALRKRLRESPKADSLPLIAKGLVGSDGTAWIKDGGYMYGEPSWGWTAVTKEGAVLGRLVGSGADPVVAFGRNAVLVRSEDDDGFVTFRVHTLNLK